MRTYQNEDIHDDASSDHDRFERTQLARDRDRRGSSTSDLGDREVSDLVEDLITEGVVEMDGAQERLVHRPTGSAFSSQSALAYFHRGWTAAIETDSTTT